ncbi:RTA1-domain-containing protein [Ramaria rubella]|nr:RTA1-domain-containing protein [Ramaria rubella]
MNFADTVQTHAQELAKGQVHRSPYGYTPTEWICILYVVLFSLTTMLHTSQTLYFKPRAYWILPTIATCGICEILGWSARLWSSRNPLEINAFLMQITTTIIAPTFLTAGFYTILGRIIILLGPRYSRLTPKAYLITFLSADVVALIVQAIGGAKASFAFQNGKSATPGAHIMLGGIFLQLVGIILYSLLATEFLLRFHLQKPFKSSRPAEKNDTSSADDEKAEELNALETPGVLTSKMSLLILGLGFATLFVLMRTVYRTIELIDGWTGRIITTEKYFNILDGAPIVLAMITLNALHPVVLLRQ